MENIIKKGRLWTTARILLVAFCVVFCLGVWPGYLIHTYKTTGELTADVTQTRQLTAGDAARQYFVPQGRWLSKIRIAVVFDEDMVTDEYLSFRLEDDEGREIAGKRIFFSELKDGCYFDVPIGKRLNAQREYVWELSLPEGAAMEYAVVCAGNTAENTRLLVNAEDIQGTALNQYEYYAHFDRSVIIGGFGGGALLILLALLELTAWLERRTGGERPAGMRKSMPGGMLKERLDWKGRAVGVCYAVLFTAAFLLRFYRLGELPDVLHIDEAGLGYNAWCLANYGVDRYLNEMPIYPQNFIGGQSPLYTYCLVLLLKLFPTGNMTLGLVRTPALLWSMLVVVCGARLLKLLFDDDRVALAGTALLAFCPYFIMSGRFALDCNMMLGCSVLAITLLVKYLKKPTWPGLLACGAGFALTLYSYALSYIALAVFLPFVSLYMLYTRKINIAKMIALAFELCVLGLPLILFVCCLLFGLPGFRFFGINILPVASERMEDLAQTDFWENVFNCIGITLTNGPYPYMLDAVEKFYTMYVVSIPFIALGFLWALVDFARSLKGRRFAYSAIFVLYALAVIITVGMAGSYVYRANAVFVCWLYLCVVGIRQTARVIRRYRRAFLAVLSACYAVWIAAFLRYYFNLYSVADSYSYPHSLYFVPEKEAVVRAVEELDAEKVYIDSIYEEFYYFYYPVSPYERERADKTGGGREVSTCVDYRSTPVEASSVYLVRRENADFINKLQHTGLAYEVEEFRYYYLFIIP